MHKFRWWKPKAEPKKNETYSINPFAIDHRVNVSFFDTVDKEEDQQSISDMEKTNNPESEKMSELDPVMPRYYDGYDIDILIRKMNDNQPLTKEEAAAYDQASDIYYKKEFERREERWQKRMEEAKKDNKNPFRFGHQVHYSSIDDFSDIQEKGGNDV